MPRRTWPGDGVGRGNGAGSRRTQFKSGMPSANPNGRPCKPKLGPDASLKDAALRVLLEQVVTTENGVRRKQSRVTAMIKLLLADFPVGNTREKLAILKYFGMLVPEAELTRNQDNQISPTAIDDLVKTLAAEGLHDEELAREFGPPL